MPNPVLQQMEEERHHHTLWFIEHHGYEWMMALFVVFVLWLYRDNWIRWCRKQLAKVGLVKSYHGYVPPLKPWGYKPDRFVRATTVMHGDGTRGINVEVHENWGPYALNKVLHTIEFPYETPPETIAQHIQELRVKYNLLQE